MKCKAKVEEFTEEAEAINPETKWNNVITRRICGNS
jgi:hypothetical protein